MDAPAFSPESLTGFAAVGAQLALFSTGPGNSYASAIAPTIKLTASAATAALLTEQIDFDASDVFEGGETADAAAGRLLEPRGDGRRRHADLGRDPRRGARGPDPSARFAVMARLGGLLVYLRTMALFALLWYALVASSSAAGCCCPRRCSSPRRCASRRSTASCSATPGSASSASSSPSRPPR